MTVKAAIDLSDSVHVIKWGKKENQVIIRPSETKEIYRMQGDKKIGGSQWTVVGSFLPDLAELILTA